MLFSTVSAGLKRLRTVGDAGVWQNRRWYSPMAIADGVWPAFPSGQGYRMAVSFLGVGFMFVVLGNIWLATMPPMSTLPGLGSISALKYIGCLVLWLCAARRIGIAWTLYASRILGLGHMGFWARVSRGVQCLLAGLTVGVAANLAACTINLDAQPDPSGWMPLLAGVSSVVLVIWLTVKLLRSHREPLTQSEPLHVHPAGMPPVTRQPKRNLLPVNDGAHDDRERDHYPGPDELAEIRAREELALRRRRERDHERDREDRARGRDSDWER